MLQRWQRVPGLFAKACNIFWASGNTPTSTTFIGMIRLEFSEIVPYGLRGNIQQHGHEQIKQCFAAGQYADGGHAGNRAAL